MRKNNRQVRCRDRDRFLGVGSTLRNNCLLGVFLEIGYFEVMVRNLP